MSNIFDTVEDRIHSAILTAIDNIVALKTDLAIRSIKASSGRDVTSESANSERRDYIGYNTSFKNASGNNNIPHVSNVIGETQHNIPVELSELSAPETRFDRQTHTHHTSVLYCTLVYCTVLYFTSVYCTVPLCIVLHCIILQCTVLYCTVPYHNALCFSALYCTLKYCTVKCYPRLSCTVCSVLYYTVLSNSVL